MTGPLGKNIALLTDFGCQDTFAGVLKGVILSICRDANIVDLSHGVSHQDIAHGSFMLFTSYRFFPKGTVFCVVVDPGVGSKRKPICIKTKDYFFVGPDNGVLWQAAKENKIEQIMNLTNTSYFLESISTTFHGRDIFAPCAAHICNRVNIKDMGKPLEKAKVHEIPTIEKKDNSLILSIIHIDVFGNITLNITHGEFAEFTDQVFCLEINGFSITKKYDHYSAAEENELFLIPSSSQYMEVAIREKNAAGLINVPCNKKAVLKRLGFKDSGQPS